MLFALTIVYTQMRRQCTRAETPISRCPVRGGPTHRPWSDRPTGDSSAGWMPGRRAQNPGKYHTTSPLRATRRGVNKQASSGKQEGSGATVPLKLSPLDHTVYRSRAIFVLYCGSARTAAADKLPSLSRTERRSKKRPTRRLEQPAEVSLRAAQWTGAPLPSCLSTATV